VIERRSARPDSTPTTPCGRIISARPIQGRADQLKQWEPNHGNRQSTTEIKGAGKTYIGTDPDTGEPISGIGGTVILEAVYDTEDEVNKAWSAATPSAKVDMLINNPVAFERFKPGHKYYVDFTPVE